MPKYRSFLQNKLWRDNAPKLMEQTDSKIDIQPLNDQEFDLQLRLKLQEEVAEVIAAPSKDHLTEELADLLEIIDALCHLHQIDKDVLYAKQKEKRDTRGGFFERKFVSVAHHIPGSFGESYCLKDPAKYPEITEKFHE